MTTGSNIDATLDDATDSYLQLLRAQPYHAEVLNLLGLEALRRQASAMVHA